MNFKLLGTGVAALALLATSFSAQAADIPRPIYKSARSVVAYYNWTGFYVGVNGGYMWGKAEFSGPAGSVSTSPNGWLVGGTVGFNYQVGSWVWGFEGDYDWVDLNGSNPSVICGGTCTIKNTWLATARGRVGYAFDRWLPYITGGGAFGRINVGNVAGTIDDTKTGWTVGGGVEYAFLGNWSGKVEYLHVDLGETGCTPICAAGINVKYTADMVRAGLNYKFSGPIFSRY